jgi:hypothetical protein
MTWYCTLQDVKDEQNITSGPDAKEDAIIFERIRQVSQRLDRLYQARRPVFLPWLEDYKIRITSDVVNSFDNTLRLDRSLLALNTITHGTTALTIGTQVEAWPTGWIPYRYLRLMDYSRSWYSDCGGCNTSPLFVTLNGLWGFHTDYANAWLETTTVSVATSTGTTITVTNVDGTDGYGRSPWISPGALLKIEDEFLLVTAVNVGTNVMTVKRGMNGTTSVNHAIGTTIYVWQVEDVVRRAVARQAAFLYARRGAYESSVVTDVGIANYPSDLLAELRGIVQGLIYES